MAIFGFKKRKDEKSDQAAEAAKSMPVKSGAPVRPIPPAQSTKPARPAPVTTAVGRPRLPAMPAGEFGSSSDAIIRPRITEKSGILSQGGVYTFEIARKANKAEVARAVKVLYRVTPVKIAVINTPTKSVFVKGRKGTVAGFKKAVVTVKKGEKIDFV
ncbi:MAG: large subunit ribosomal protein [Candidatus Parcubacteria bacterium]|jgi:large subunit ribosomal protein L23|nr:large subunit ribosomal protein [Candidatus Parcubacteria bacterium]